MALWRPEILIIFIVNTLFIILFKIFSNDSDTTYRESFARPKPFFDGTRQRLLDLNDFRYITDSNVCDTPCTPILVHSYVGHFEFRRAIRLSYPQIVLDQLGFRYVFMTGMSDSARVQTQLRLESSRHGDIVQGNFWEAYRNLTYKHIMGLRWFADRCRRSMHMVKMDDDIAVNMFRLKDVVNDSHDLAGCVIRAKPIRDQLNKWYVSKTEFAGDKYPAFLSGWLYVAATKSVRRLLRAINEHENYFWIDDLYVTGMLAKRSQIDLTDLRSEYETDPGPINCCIQKRQRCGFLAAPSGDNYELLQPYSEQLIRCKATNSSCDAFRKSKLHHSCLDFWKKKPKDKQVGKSSIEILN